MVTVVPQSTTDQPQGLSVEAYTRTITREGLPALSITVLYHPCTKIDNSSNLVPAGSPSRDGDVAVLRFWHKPPELAHSFFILLLCLFLSFYGPFHCISFHKFSRQLSAFSLCSSGLISALLILSTKYLFMKVSLSPDVTPSGWLGSKHQLTN